MGGRDSRSEPPGPKDRWGIGRWEDKNAGGVACRTG